ncbi:hypothetical protein ACU686_16320 [Yinghuangia aomiensis]
MLSNPRHTGRQVWNRQRTDHELIDPDNTHPRPPRRDAPQHPRRVGDLRKAGTPGPGQRGRLRRRTGHSSGEEGCRAGVPARWAPAPRALQSAHGVLLVKRACRVPLPPWTLQRHTP